MFLIHDQLNIKKKRVLSKLKFIVHLPNLRHLDKIKITSCESELFSSFIHLLR